MLFDVNFLELDWVATQIETALGAAGI